MQKDKPGVSASALTTYGSKHVGGRRHHGGLSMEDGGFVAQHIVENPEARQARAI
jgi:hypothetical protein